MLTLQELKERLCHLDELTILEVLEVEKETLVNRLEDFIEDKYDELVGEFSNDNYE